MNGRITLWYLFEIGTVARLVNDEAIQLELQLEA